MTQGFIINQYDYFIIEACNPKLDKSTWFRIEDNLKEYRSFEDAWEAMKKEEACAARSRMNGHVSGYSQHRILGIKKTTVFKRPLNQCT